jgi:acyl-coenzyme A synthetase/AMP-(fatty) acid ligase
VGIYSPSNLDYLINIYALGRLGYTSFLISPRLPAKIVATLLKNTKARILVHGPDNQQLAQTTSTLTEFPLKTVPLIQRSIYDSHDGSLQTVTRDVDPLKEQYRPYILLHSSGSTGLPKPVTYTNARLIVTCLPSPALIAFQSLPLSHAHGLVTYSQAIWSRKTIYLFNANVPHTNKALTEAIKASKPEIVWTVPYVLKLLAESDEGIETLKQCSIVSSSGSRLPDELGDMLTEKGVFLGCLFGSYVLNNLQPSPRIRSLKLTDNTAPKTPFSSHPYTVHGKIKHGITYVHRHTWSPTF